MVRSHCTLRQRLADHLVPGCGGRGAVGGVAALPRPGIAAARVGEQAAVSVSELEGLQPWIGHHIGVQAHQSASDEHGHTWNNNNNNNNDNNNNITRRVWGGTTLVNPSVRNCIWSKHDSAVAVPR